MNVCCLLPRTSSVLDTGYSMNSIDKIPAHCFHGSVCWRVNKLKIYDIMERNCVLKGMNEGRYSLKYAGAGRMPLEKTLKEIEKISIAGI